MRGYKPTDKCADEATQAPASVKRVEDRSAIVSLDSYPLRIHRDVHRSVAGTKEDQGRDENRQRRCERQQGKDQAETQCRNRGHRPAPEASSKIASHIHRYERTGRCSKQSEAKLAWAQRKSGLHRWKACRPGGKNRPIEKKT